MIVISFRFWCNYHHHQLLPEQAEKDVCFLFRASQFVSSENTLIIIGVSLMLLKLIFLQVEICCLKDIFSDFSSVLFCLAFLCSD